MDGGLIFEPQILTTAFTQDDRLRGSVLEFFAARIRNANTRATYLRGVGMFSSWCDVRGLDLLKVSAVDVALFIEMQTNSIPTVKIYLSALRMFFDFLVVKGHIPFNPALSVKAPRYSQTTGKTPYFVDDEPRVLLDSIETDTLIGLRDRAVISTMLYTFARVSAVVHMRGEDYFLRGRRSFLALHEKGGKRHVVPANHKLEEALDAYVERAQVRDDKKGYLFRSCLSEKQSGAASEPLSRQGVFLMVKRRCEAAGLGSQYGCHSFRATGITAFRRNGGTLEKAQQIAAHASSQTTKLYDRTCEEVNIEEVERIRF